MNHEIAIDIVQRMMRAYQGLRLYPAQHPNIRRQVQEWHQTLTQLLAAQPRVVLGIHQGTLFCNDYLFSEPLPAADGLLKILADCQVESVIIQRGLLEGELLDFLVITANGSPSFEAVETAMKQAGIRNLTLVGLDEEAEDTTSQASQVYQQAIQVTENIFNDVRMGKIPSSSEASQVVKRLVETTLAEPHALLALSLIKDYDDYTFTHSVNVSVIALAVGRACGLQAEQLRILGMGGLLHDLGKLKIDISIINKPGRLTSNEFEVIKGHPEAGAQIIAEMSNIPREVSEITLYHHLRYDRSGYPVVQVPIELSPMVDMVTIADAYDAMTTLRPYQRPMTPRRAIQHLKETAGTFYHPQILTKFTEDLGPYPVGSVVRLQDNRIALVIKVGLSGGEAMQLKVLFDADGQQLPTPEPMELALDNLWFIVAEVDPLFKGIQITDFF